MRQNKPRCSLFTCTLTIVGALLLTTTLLSHNYATQQHHQIPRPHALRGPASHLAALRDARDAAASGFLLRCCRNRIAPGLASATSPA